MKLSQRVYPPRFEKEEEFQVLLDFLIEYRDIVDEISLFAEYWSHGYFPLDKYFQRSSIIKDRIKRLHENGFKSVGVNMLTTTGQGNDAWDFLPDGPFQRLTGHDGVEAKTVYCSNEPSFMSYIKEKYKLLAETKPDFIWVDDDMRINHKGVAHPCFCPYCISLFNKQVGTDHTRETLVAALDMPENKDLRRKWFDFSIHTLENLLKEIKETVHQIDPSIELGFMTIAPTGITRWSEALKTEKIRPGGGFYNDRSAIDLLTKAIETGRQIVEVPGWVQDIQYELENFPYQNFLKSAYMTATECTAAFMVGCNGIAFDLLDQEPGSNLREKRVYMDAIRKIKPLWENIARVAEGKNKTVVRGAWPAISPNQRGHRNINDGETWFSYIPGDIGGTGGNGGYVLYELGVPLTPDADGASCNVLVGRSIEGYSKDELQSMLSEGVLMDGDALSGLIRMGLGDLCGAEIVKTYNNGVMEEFTSHWLNGGAAGTSRDVRLSFCPTPSYILKPEAGSDILANLVGYNGETLGPCAIAFENRLGGRVVIMGYFPWASIHSLAKREQILNSLDWASKGSMPVRVETEVKVIPIVRDSDSERLIFLINASFDPADECVIDVRGRWETVQLVSDGSGLAASASEGGLRVDIGKLEPWEYRVVLLK